jgi:hypothetical protein
MGRGNRGGQVNIELATACMVRSDHGTQNELICMRWLVEPNQA